MGIARRPGAGLIAVLAAAAVGAPAAHAKTEKVSLKMKSALTSTTLKGTFSGSPLGRGSVLGKANLPYFTITFQGQGGSATLRLKGAPKGDKITGSWTWLRGTGKFRGIKGAGKAVGAPSGDFTFTGRARY